MPGIYYRVWDNVDRVMIGDRAKITNLGIVSLLDGSSHSPGSRFVTMLDSDLIDEYHQEIYELDIVKWIETTEHDGEGWSFRP